MKKIEITEEDIFNFALYQEELSAAKRKHIADNYDVFKDRIELCLALKLVPGNDGIESLREKITAMTNKPIIELLPIECNNDEANNFALAAASPEVENIFPAVSFVDKNSLYLIRVVNVGDKSLMYIFASGDIAEMKLTMYPSQEKIVVDDFSVPIERESKEKINRIVVTEIL